MTATEKLDLYKEHKTEYAAPKKPVLVKVAPAQYLAVDGDGKPGGGQFEDAISTLYSVAFTIKMTSKTSGRDYTVCKLEGLWSIDGDKPFNKARSADIHYTLMIRTPDFIKNSQLNEAQDVLASRGKTPRVHDVKLVTLKEGRCVQMLHVGPYDGEEETLARMREFATAEGLSPEGRHHEIYLSDPRRVAPERLRTILRFPVR